MKSIRPNPELQKRSKLDIVREVVENHQYTKVKMIVGSKSRTVILDGQTANAILNLYNNASPNNIHRLNSLSWDNLWRMAYGKKS